MEFSLKEMYKELALKRALEPLRELRESFIGTGAVKGFEFTQIEKSDKAYIYKVDTKLDSIHYEVFKRVINEAFNVVSYPRATRFGQTAWTYRSLINAQEKFKELSISDPIKDSIGEPILNT